MKRNCQAICHRCGRVWIAVTQKVLQGQELCQDCKAIGLVRFNPPIGVV